MNPSGTYTVKEVAAFLRVTPQAVYNMIKREEIAAFKVGSAVRVLAADLDAFVAAGKRALAAQLADFAAPPAGVVAVRKLRARFGPFVLDSIDFELPEGSSLGVVGPSGSGKTLLLKALAGLVPLEAGAIFHGPDRLDGTDPRDRRVGLVFQDYALYPTMDGGRNIGFPLETASEPRTGIDAEVLRIAAELGIGKDYLGKRIEALPEGIKQLVAIGRSRARPASRPVRLLLMDEPLIHLDARVREETRAFLKRLVSRIGATVVYAFNDAADALALSDYLLVVEEGKGVQFGRAEDVYARPASPSVMELLSADGVVALEASYSAGAATVLLPDGGPAAALPAPLPDGSGAYEGPCLLCFRPEETEPAPAAAGGDSPPRSFSALVERAAPWDGERAVATGRLLAPGRTVPADGAPRASFLADYGEGGTVEGVRGFQPKAPVAFPRT